MKSLQLLALIGVPRQRCTACRSICVALKESFRYFVLLGCLLAAAVLAGAAECAKPAASGDPKELARLGRCHIETKDFRTAAQLYAGSLALAPDSPDALEGMGESLYGLGAVREAIPYLDRAVKLGQSGARRTLAYAYADANDFLRAEKLLRAFAADHRGDAECRSRLGELMYRNAFYGAAVQWFDAARAMAPESAAARAHRAVSLVQLARMPEAEIEFQRLLADPALAKDPELLLVYAQLLYETGRAGAALEQVDKAAGSTPGYTMVHFWRARILLRLNREEEACKEAEMAVRLAPALPFARALLLEIYRRQGREKESEAQAGWLREYEEKVANTRPQ